METMAQRIEALRTEKNMSRPALASALGFPRTALEKFETGRATPTQDQQKKLAEFFGITVAELKNGRGDMSDWMSGGAYLDGTASVSVPQPRVQAAKPAPSAGEGASGSMLDGLLNSKKLQEALREAALEVLRSPEGQEILSNVVRRELMKLERG